MELQSLKQLMFIPITFQDVCLELIDVVDAHHEPCWQVMEHKHPWFEFNYVESGVLTTLLPDSSFDTAAGESLLIPPGILHANRSSLTRADDGFCLRFTLKKAKNDCDGLFDSLLSAFMSPAPSSFLCDISMFHKTKSPFAAQAAVMDWLLSIYDTRIATPIPAANPIPGNLSNRVILYLNEYYPSKIYVSDIAKALNMSYRNLARVFKRETGSSIIETLTEIRINRAKQLLLTTSRPLVEIAAAVGFENEYYFSNAFFQSQQLRPSQFRKEYQR